jgi:thioredoxin reductase (NADPH)
MKADNVEFLWNSAVVDYTIDDKITGAKIKNLISGEINEKAFDGIFVSIGRKPATEIFEGQLELDKNGYVVADETTRTSIPGVYAVGDVRTKILRQVITAASDGAVAAHFAEEYILSE